MKSAAAIFLVVLLVTAPIAAQTISSRIPPRVAEEAEVLQQNASRIVTEESLLQRSILPPSRFRPRVGSVTEQTTGPRMRAREVASELSFGTLHSSGSPDLLEFRQVLSVDGVPLQTADSAIRALSQDVRQGDDRIRKRMLEKFARNGLVDIATDFALILLAFSRRGQAQMEIFPARSSYIGTDPTLAFSWKQESDAAGLLEFNGQQSTHRSLQGTLWVRSSDGLPLRVNAWIEYSDAAGRRIRDDATVDYILSEHGFVTPVSVVHRHLVSGDIVTENLYRYQPFKLFSTSSSITFGALPETPLKK